uniref:CSD domain-containing protein n=1 Tax=uncultured Thiotrichaceae bacterium TaxID=298394 RepID=A0A6S6TS50_9GAMM|nr:MAG: protein of unknown function DUF1294 [uncultured Thiotrichaceae bacterium]
MKYQGKIQNWNDDRGFGFVEPNGGGQRAFVHIKAFSSRSRRPLNGEVITYELVSEGNNRYKAANVNFARDTKNAKSRGKSGSGFSLGAMFTLAFFGVLLVSVLADLLPLMVAGIYAVMSVVTFIAYALDKSAAQNNRWRTKENTLHLLALAGGWPGAYLAQEKLRHKSSKKEFQLVFKVVVVLNLLGFAWLYTEQGAGFLEQFVRTMLVAW